MIVTIDGLEVIGNGSVHVLQDESVVFVFDDGDGILRVKLTFKDLRNSETDITYDEVSEQEVILTFINFADPEGIGNGKKLFEVGQFRDRKLYLRYFIKGTKESENMLLYYTWFLWPAVS
ncbi:hypothetical protein CIG75_07330 [Tumebacillus algifaecis]|uniref:Uncharacterized protein n=1 Tax=Tumebacillus algifaecis TaxID=1214604 RepID=A0A223CZM2_9BACL|nr:hypothetical protein [Tumebacillus algifaecis]ASS74808.1 hypothetical protein CIG75_07330 [Tumebacillus algifaecis]